MHGSPSSPSPLSSTKKWHSASSIPALEKQYQSSLESTKENARLRFESYVKRYYYQLTIGCGIENCPNKLCKSNKTNKASKLQPDAAAILAVQLASRPKVFFCKNCPMDPQIMLPEMSKLNPSSSQYSPITNSPQSPQPKPFLYSLLSSSPFSSIFTSPANSPTNHSPSVDGLHLGSPTTPVFSNSNRQRSVTTGEFDGERGSVKDQFEGKQDGKDDEISKHKWRAKSFLDLPSLLSASVSLTSKLTRTFSGQLQPLRHSSSNSSHSNTPDQSISQSPSIPENLAESTDSTSTFTDITPEYLTLPMLEGLAAKCNVETPTGSPSKHLHRLRIEEANGNAANVPVTYLDEISATLSKPPSLQKSISSLSISSPEFPPNSRTLISIIRHVFSNVDCLSKSFKVAEEECDNGDIFPNGSYVEVQKFGGVDLDASKTAFEIILDVEPKDKVTLALTNAIEIALAKLSAVPRSLTDPDDIAPILILLENPLLSDSAYQESLLKPLCLTIAGLRQKVKSILVGWFSCYSEQRMLRLLNILKQYLIDHFYPAPKTDEVVVAVVRVLGLLYSANELSSPRIIEYTKFYNTQLAKKINFKDEYKNWKKTLEAKKITDFSFFNYPFLLDPVAKSRILHIDAMVQMSQEYEDACVNQAFVLQTQRLLNDSTSRSNSLETLARTAANPYLVFEVRRTHLIDDVIHQLHLKSRDLKKPLKVKFVEGGEEGLDQGGVQKEFFQVVIEKFMDPVYGMFSYDEQTRFSWINGNSLESEKQYEFVGVVMGLAVYNGIILDLTFPKLMFKKLLDESVTLEDLKEAFPDLGRGLEQMLNWSDGDVYDIFMRNFEISYDIYGQVKNYPLVDGGENIPVTNENRQEYVRLYIDHIVNESVKRQFIALKRGFYKVCGGVTLRLCRPEELELLMCGQNCDLDFHELEKATTYDDGYFAQHPTIRNFWSIVHGFSTVQKKKLLSFVTASDRIPIKGLSEVTFVIQRNGPDSDRLPTALTCFGRLLLPEYGSKEKLRDRLVVAIDNAKGFGLV